MWGHFTDDDDIGPILLREGTASKCLQYASNELLKQNSTAWVFLEANHDFWFVMHPTTGVSSNCDATFFSYTISKLMQNC